MVRFIPGTMIIEEEEEDDDKEEDDDEKRDEHVHLLLDRNDGWSHCFFCTDEHLKPVQDIIHDAVCIHFSQRERIESTFTLETWRQMGEALSWCRKLEQFVMDSVRLTPEILKAIFRAEGGSYDFPLEILSLMWGDFGTEGMRVLHPFLRDRTVPMKVLCLRCARMDEDGAALLGEVLDRVPIKNLDVCANPLGVGGISKILSAKHARSLTYLQLGDNAFSRPEISQVAKFLQQNDVILDYLSIGESDFDIEWVKSLLHSLEKNTNLGALVISPWSSWFDEYDNTEYVDVDTFHKLNKAIISLTCNTSSIQALCKSNHTLWRLNKLSSGILSPAARTLLIINGMNISTNDKIRLKLRSFYFKGAFCMRSFLSMRLTCMPRVLELVTQRDDDPEETIRNKWGNPCIQKEKGDLNGVYTLVRNWNLTDLFGYASKKAIGERLREEKFSLGLTPKGMDLYSHFQLDSLLSEIGRLPGWMTVHRRSWMRKCLYYL